MISTLAIDPGSRAGAALYRGTDLVRSWQVKPGAEWDVVTEAVNLAVGAPLVVVRENWTLGGRETTHKRADGSSYKHTNISMLAGLGVAWGRWESVLHHEGIKRVVKVYARTWQAMISGRVLKRDDMLALTKRIASSIAHREVGEDEAVAIMLGRYAATQGLHRVHAELSIADGKRLGVDVATARERVKAEKAMKRAKKQRRAA